MFERSIIKDLRKWAANPYRKPLILRGAFHQLDFGGEAARSISCPDDAILQCICFDRRYAGSRGALCCQ